MKLTFMRQTKVVCTLGPASQKKSVIKNLIQLGMDVARINFSHGTHEELRRIIRTVRRTARQLDKPISILGDLQGPKIRIGEMPPEGVYLKRNGSFILTTKKKMGSERGASTNYRYLFLDIKKGNEILLDDGLIRMRVVGISGKEVRCKVLEGGILHSRKGISLPGIPLRISSFTEKDKRDIVVCAEQELDYIALSFVRSAKDIRSLKNFLRRKFRSIPVIAKLEKPQAIHCLSKILDIADGVMIARGDLGVEMSLDQVPVLQKEIIEKANAKKVPVITATQMLESMTQHSRPTRAEASDVANAIFDGTDAVMLSGETAVGKYPEKAVEVMVQIIKTAESHLRDKPEKLRRETSEEFSIPDAVGHAASMIAESKKVRAIVAFTHSGRTAQLISKYRPQIPIIAFAPHSNIQRVMNLYWGVIPKYMPLIENTDELIEQVDRILLKERIVSIGDLLIITLGAPVFVQGSTNLLKLHRVGKIS
ncbi:pyruvate kinase [candidate division KSB1 bacterium]